MAFCKHREMDKCNQDGRPCVYDEMCFEPEEEKPMSTADKIRSMTNAELAHFLSVNVNCMTCSKMGSCNFNQPECEEDIKEWLEQPWRAEDGERKDHG